MNARNARSAWEGSKRTGFRLLALLMLLGAAAAPTDSQAQAVSCSEFPDNTIDGFIDPDPPSNIEIDGDCTIRNFPESNPLSSNFDFYAPGGGSWLIVFDNVYHIGNMSCNNNDVHQHKIWFTNGSTSGIRESCRDLFIPVEKIDKQSPAPTAAIGVPFTYTLKIPVLFQPAPDGEPGTVIDTEGSLNDLHSITIWDDLNDTGVDLTYVGHSLYWLESGVPIPHTFSNQSGLLTFDSLPVVPAGEQIILEITVVLEDVPENAPGTEFVNTAKWDFGRLIDGVFYEPLPGEWGISPPMTIAAPQLVVTKTGPATLGRTLNLGEWGEFGIDVHNTGLGDAWDVTILDRLPDGPAGGMCDIAPELLSAQVFLADGVTPAPGKGPLQPGVDLTIDFDAAAACELTLTMLTPEAVIGADERLIVTYRTRLDPDTQDGIALTNVAGAVQWFNGDSSNPDRVGFTRTLTDGTVGVADHEDAHTVMTALFGYFFEKSVVNVTSGANPATTAAPGDRLRYTLRLQTTDGALDNVRILDDLGVMNPTAVFQPGTLTLLPGTIPPGANASNTDPSGGTNGAGILDIRNLDVPAASQIQIQFEITLAPALLDGTVVSNQADLRSAGIKIADSDDPNVNGQADPSVPGDEDPTRVVIQAEAPDALLKATTQATATIGEAFSYRITVPSVPHSAALYDVRILDNLAASAADLEFVSVQRISGSGSWTPTNTGTATNLVIEDPVNGIDIPAGQQAVIEITVRLRDTATNVAGLTFTNAAAFTYNQLNNNDSSMLLGDAGVSGPMTIVEPELTMEKTGPVRMRPIVPGTFTLNVQNIGDSPAFGLTITDLLPNTAQGGTCDAAPAQVTAQVFEADGVTAVSPALGQGTDFTVAFAGTPECTLTLTMQTVNAAIGPGQRLIVTYQTVLDADSESDAVLTDIAGATRWFGVQDYTTNDEAREYIRTLTDGTVGVLDHEDAHTTVVNLSVLQFEKSVANVTRGDNPATAATPGDTLRYTLTVENVSDIELGEFSIRDELDRLNGTPAFQAGTLNVITVPAGADLSNTSATGGADGTGILDVRNLNLGGLGDSVTIVFEVVLAPVITNGSYVLNQSQLLIEGVVIEQSDDPNVNGAADPNVVGDEDPTRVLIESAPDFRVEKVSSYITGDPNVLLAGETLRYTITVQNVGTDIATDARLVDQTPANTTYVPGSTTLNGIAVPDSAGGSPLIGGILVNAEEDPTPGTLHAVPAGSGDHVATIVFDVVVDPAAIDGTVISNQGFVSASDAGVIDQPSDDPRTPTVDDPTRDVVGNLPLLFAEKSVALEIDLGTPGIVDPGDTLRYTIAVHNNGNVPATMVDLTDDVPADTTYVENSVTLNGLAVGQPDNGVFPLAAGIPISSSDLTPPIPGAGEGTLSPGETAVVQFDMRVDDGVPSGTIISNQAVVGSDELADLLTDGDGNPATGPEPTVVVVGDAQQLSITKQVSVVGGGAALAGATLEYAVTVRNIASVPAHFVQITDDLDAPVAGQLAYVDQSATMNGSASGTGFAGSVLTADYSTTYGPLDPGDSIVLRFRATIEPTLAIGTTVTNTATVNWNDPQQTASASVSIDVGGTPGTGALNGTVWHDADFDDTVDGPERLLEGWTVQLLRNGTAVHQTQTDAGGSYRMTGLAPNSATGELYALAFSAPGAGMATAALGMADSQFTNSLQRIDDIIVNEGSNLQDLNLPIDPNGTVYNALTRLPIAGATLMLLEAASGTPVPSDCLDDPRQQNQVTLADGYYKFVLNFSQPSCATGGGYLVQVTPPGAGYVDGPSEIIPPLTSAATPPFNVPTCPGSVDDAITATSEYCEVQASEFAPGTGIAARSTGTNYHSHLVFDDSRLPGSGEIFNNHIPLDPVLDGAVSITKTSPQLNVTRGQLVPYVITVNNSIGIDLTDVAIVDRFPAGFRYVEGSARLDDVAVEPVINGLELAWTNLSLTASGQHTIKLLLAVGAGVSEGEFVNRAQVFHALTGNALSGEATATVRLVPDPTFDCTDVTGKVFDDHNRNGYQDGDEAGLAGVRVVTARGLAATTDEFGRFHFTCAIVPNESRGSNFVLKLDDRTLPTGYRPSANPVQIKRATRGKALRFNFGASIHRVVGLDVAGEVFEPGTTEIRHQWQSRFGLLLEELQKGPAVLRLSYLADVEDETLVERRLDAVKKQITDAWTELECCYELVIEPEIYWRLGGPPDKPKAVDR